MENEIKDWWNKESDWCKGAMTLIVLPFGVNYKQLTIEQITLVYNWYFKIK